MPLILQHQQKGHQSKPMAKPLLLRAEINHLKEINVTQALQNVKVPVETASPKETENNGSLFEEMERKAC